MARVAARLRSARSADCVPAGTDTSPEALADLVKAFDPDEGRAIVSSMFPEIGVSSRVYYTAGERDKELLSITDSKVVVFGKGNYGD